MTPLKSLILGIIQGLTEFIPISSTAHLLFGQKLLGISADDASFSFTVLVQLGTLVSLLVYFRKDLLEILRAALHKSINGNPDPMRKLGWLLLLATLPAVIAGLLFKDLVEAFFRAPMLQAAVRLLSTAILLALAENFNRKQRRLDSTTWKDALWIGLSQVLAIFPGSSRSGATISGGMFRGFERKEAARFAFMMSVPVMLAAGTYETLDVLKMPDLVSFLPMLGIGFLTAAITGWLAIRWLMKYLHNRALTIFSIYCLLMGITALIVHFVWV